MLHERRHAVPKGTARLKRIEAILEEPSSGLPALVREGCQDLIEQIAEKAARIEAKAKKARALSLLNDTARWLQAMPGASSLEA